MAFDGDSAARYEAWYDTQEGRRVDEMEKALLNWLLEAFGRPATVLEVGCGTGHFTRWLGEQGLAAVGLDASPPMLAAARALNGVSLIRGDARRLPFADGAFDLTAIITALEFMDRPQDALAEALRVARCGVVIGVLNRWSLLALRRRLNGLFRPTVYDAARFYSVPELVRLLRRIAGKEAHVVWRTTLLPRACPWPQTRLPWGGFIGMALIVNDATEPDRPLREAAEPTMQT